MWLGPKMDVGRFKSGSPVQDQHNIMYALCMHYVCIIESVDSISRDGPDTPISVIHYKMPKNSPKTKI